MNRRTPIQDGDASLLAGDVASPSRSTAGPTAQIISFPVPSAAASWDLGESELEEDVFPLGSLACRLVGQFERPRILVWSAPEGPREEEPNPPEL